jgi:hypothetical protein
MADAINIDQLISGSKTLKQLVKDIESIRQHNDDQPDEVTGVRLIDKTLGDLKDTFKNNETTKFFKDPIKSISGGFKGLLSPLEAIGDGITDSFKKGFKGIGQAAQMKMLRENNKSLTQMAKAQQKIIKALDIANDLSEEDDKREKKKDRKDERTGFKALALQLKEKLGIDKIKTGFDNFGKLFKDNVGGFFSRTRSSGGQDGEQGGDIQKPKNIFQKMASGLGNMFGGDEDNKESSDASFKGGSLGELNDAQARRHKGLLGSIRRNIRDPLEGIAVSLDSVEESLIDLIVTLDPEKASRLAQRRADRQDQSIREGKRDDDIAAEERNESIIKALGKIGLGDAGAEIGKKGGGLFGLIKDNLLGFLVGAGGAVGGALLALFKQISLAFGLLAKNFKSILVGSAALAIMATSLYAWVDPLKRLGKSLDEFGIKEALTFATVIATMVGAMFVLGSLIAGTGGIGLIPILAGVGVLALIGAGISGFFALMGFDHIQKGMKGFNEFLDMLPSFSHLAGAAAGLALLSVSLLAFGAASLVGGLLNFFGGNPLKKITEFAEHHESLKSSADSVDRLTESLRALRTIKGLGAVSEFLGLTRTALGGGITGNAFKNKMQKAADGLEIFFKAMNKGLKQIDHDKLVDVTNTLGQISSLNDIGNQIINGEAINRNLELLLQNVGGGANGGGNTIVNQGDTANNTVINQTPTHFDNKSLAMVLPT